MNELIDFRLNVTVETDHYFEALSKATGRCKKELAREELHKLAVKLIHETNIASSYLHSKGLAKE